MKIEKLRDYLGNIFSLEKLLILQEKRELEIFIVGGIIRDFLLERIDKKEMIEIDFAVKQDTRRIAQIFAREIKGHFVILDEEKQSYRVILKERKTYQFDFSQFRGVDIEKDLYLRDFTINSLAISLKGLKDRNYFKLIDPYGGLKDVKKRVIRIVSEFSFTEDPLRIIRAFTFSQELGFKIDHFTKKLAKENVFLLSKVPGERITEQLARILESNCSYKTIKEMDKLGILEEIFPIVKEMKGVEQGPYHHLDIWGHSLETLKELELLLPKLYGFKKIGKKMKEYLEEEITGTRKRLFVIKLGALFHDLGKPQAKEITSEGKIRFIGHEKIGKELAIQIADRIRLASRERNILTKLIQLHLRPGYLVDTKDISPRAKLRFFRAGEEESVGIILIALADKFATRGPLTPLEDQRKFKEYLLHILETYFLEKELVKPKRLLDGNEVMRILNISPGILVGKILKALEEAQVEKKIKDKEDAEQFVKEIYNKGVDNVE